MAVGNTVTIIGNVTRDPELRFTNSGMAVASFGVAINTGRRNPQTGQWEEGEPSFFDVSCFREMADNVAESLQKGTRVIVTGRLNQRTWQTDTGEKRSKVEIIADEVGPSLRWATATVQRNERREAFDGASRTSGSSEPVPDYPDEEPF